MKFRLLPFDVADGARNMAADEALLLAALPRPDRVGQASIRFYGWTEATVSLGYFQPAQTRHNELGLAELPWVRRMTGGAMLVHHYELTYALAVPLTTDKSEPRAWMSDMHRVVGCALDDLGLSGRFTAASASSGAWRAEPRKGSESVNSDRSRGSARRLNNSGAAEESSLCFVRPTAGDLLHGRHKLLGSSQRKHHQALLQHGALLLAQSPYTPSLPGIRELTGVDLDAKVMAATVVEAFQKMAGADVDSAAWSTDEEETIARLIAGKYRSAEWNEKR